MFKCYYYIQLHAWIDNPLSILCSEFVENISLLVSDFNVSFENFILFSLGEVVQFTLLGICQLCKLQKNTQDKYIRSYRLIDKRIYSINITIGGNTSIDKIREKMKSFKDEVKYIATIG